MNELTEGI